MPVFPRTGNADLHLMSSTQMDYEDGPYCPDGINNLIPVPPKQSIFQGAELSTVSDPIRRYSARSQGMRNSKIKFMFSVE